MGFGSAFSFVGLEGILKLPYSFLVYFIILIDLNRKKKKEIRQYKMTSSLLHALACLFESIEFVR